VKRGGDTALVYLQRRSGVGEGQRVDDGLGVNVGRLVEVGRGVGVASVAVGARVFVLVGVFVGGRVAVRLGVSEGVAVLVGVRVTVKVGGAPTTVNRPPDLNSVPTKIWISYAPGRKNSGATSHSVKP
jgi:hypothetical protein